MTSIVVTEIKALALRHRLMDRLDGRIDIVNPAQLRPALANQIKRFLVAGLDNDAEPGAGGWPVPTGGRYAKLCFSPALDRTDASAHVMSHRLPLTIDDYEAYVARITGIGPDLKGDFARIFRIDPEEMFGACQEMRTKRPQAWQLLLSNEFALARAAWPDLDTDTCSQFRYPLVDAFMLVAELERASLIMRHLARTRLFLNRPEFIDALRSTLPLRAYFKADQLAEVYRWIEYATFSTTAFADLLTNRSVDQILTLPRGYAPWAIARGDMIGAAADFHDDRQIRDIMIGVFTPPPLPKKRKEDKDTVERKRSMLRSHQITRWYGMTNDVIPILALDDAREVFPTRRARAILTAPFHRRRKTVEQSSRPVLMRLACAIRSAADPDVQRALVEAALKYNTGSKRAAGNDIILDANMKLGLRMARAYLPARVRLGSAARFDPQCWKTPQRDADLWKMLISPERSGKLFRQPHPARRQLRTWLGLLRRVYIPLFGGLAWSDDVARIACDMGVALSPISANQQISFAIHRLGMSTKLKARFGVQGARPGYSKNKSKPNGKRR